MFRPETENGLMANYPKDPRTSGRSKGRPKGQRPTSSITKIDAEARQIKPGPNEILHLGPWLDRCGMKQTELANAVGVGKSYINQLISGEKENPSAVVVLRISRALEIPMDDLYLPPPTRQEVEKIRKYSRQTIEKLQSDEHNRS